MPGAQLANLLAGNGTQQANLGPQAVERAPLRTMQMTTETPHVAQFRTLTLIAAIGASLQVHAEGTRLETDDEKFSYGIGTQIGQSLKRQGVTVDPDAFAMAIRDAMQGNPPRLAPEEMERVMTEREAAAREDIRATASRNLSEGKAFREQYAQGEGVKRLSNGILYKVEREGSGKHPTVDDRVRVHYKGTLTDGREFDSSYRRGDPAEFPLGGVIEGWQETLPLMREGAKWQIVVPPELAYGVRGAGAVIGPNATLVFDIELLEVL